MLELEKFLNILDDLDKVKRVYFNKSNHLKPDGVFTNNWKFFNEASRNQYFGRLNSSLHGITSMVNDLNKHDEPINDESSDFPFEYDTKEIADDIIRIAELLREDNSLIGYVNEDGMLYGVVSDKHLYISDKIIFDALIEFCDGLNEPYTLRLDHNIQHMSVDVIFDNLQMEVKKGDIMKAKVNITNGAFGHESLRGFGGTYRLVCANGIGAWSGETLAINHRLTQKVNVEYILNKLRDWIPRGIKSAFKKLEMSKQALEVLDEFIEDHVPFIQHMNSNFDIRVQEARDIFSIIKANNYDNTAFWVSQAVSECAHQRPIERRLELERTAEEIMFAVL